MTNQLMEMVNKIISAEEYMALLEAHEMNQSHLISMHGPKRLHRYMAMDRGRHSLKLQCFMVEYFHVEPTISVSFTKPSGTSSLVDSFKMMYDKSIDHITTLKTTAKMAFDEGEDLLGDYLERMVVDQSKEAECYYRIWMDFKRDNADFNYLSKELHKKYKGYEREKFHFKSSKEYKY